jgi:DNA-binding LytR/AlgR family response regulator
MIKLLEEVDGRPVIRYYKTGAYYEVDMEALRALRADDKYVDAYLSNGEVNLLSISLRKLIAVLKNHGYMKIHRGCIVRKDAIARTVRVKGNVHVLLHGLKETMPVSEANVKKVREVIAENNKNK